LAVANSFAAIAAGANQIQTATNSLGERVGNTPTELMLVNMRFLGMIDRTSRCSGILRESGASDTHVDPAELSRGGARRLSHSYGVHRRALIKAYRKGDPGLADAVYAGFPLLFSDWPGD